MVTFGSRQTKLLVRGRSAEAQQPQGAITGKKGMFLRGGQHSQSEADALNSEPTCAVGRSPLGRGRSDQGAVLQGSPR